MEKNDTDEIDLFALLIKMIRLLRANAILFGVLIVAGLVISVLIYHSAVKITRAGMMVRSDIVTPPNCNILVENLNSFIARADLKGLAAVLNLSEAEAVQLRSVKASTIAARDSAFLIWVQVHDTQVLTKLQEGILNYLRNIEFIKKRNQLRAEYDHAMIRRIGLEMKLLDSLRNILFKSHFQGPSSAIIDPGNMFSTMTELNKLQIGYQNELETSGVQLVAGMTISGESESIYLSLLMGFIGGIFASFLILSIRWIIQVAKT